MSKVYISLKALKGLKPLLVKDRVTVLPFKLKALNGACRLFAMQEAAMSMAELIWRKGAGKTLV